MQKNNLYLFTILFAGVIFFTSCSVLTSSKKTECSCIYFDFTTGAIVSECGPGNCGGEKITYVSANTHRTSNVDFNTALLDSAFASPSLTFRITLSAQALNRARTKGIIASIRTERSDVWFSLNAGPGDASSGNRYYFTRHHPF
jgi:hypothetical protein